MLSVSQAQALVLEHTQPLPPEMTSLTPAVLGQVLAEDVMSDIDMPPYDKALMDGFAVRAADLPQGNGVLTIIEEITAGNVPRNPLGPGQAARIMTGAPLPAGADAVVMVERSRTQEGDRVQLDDGTVNSGQNILYQGREIHRGETVLTAGTVLRPQELGLLATMGRTVAKVYPSPRVAVLPTGDEVVEPDRVPGPGQIRNSNGPMLLAQAARAGGIPHYLGIARDRLDSLHSLIREGLKAPVVLLSGGVSAGKLDLVPQVLQEAGVRAHFHKVEMKPGKPVFFGTREAADEQTRKAGPASGCLVFGLPGNPVSSLVCFELFVLPAVRRLRGHADPGPNFVLARLTEDFAYRTDRPTYHPAWLDAGDQGWEVRPVPWFGSANLRGLTEANAFVFFTPGDHRHRAGQVCPVLKVEA
jgi:molybdopterin molybdotransferase